MRSGKKGVVLRGMVSFGPPGLQTSEFLKNSEVSSTNIRLLRDLTGLLSGLRLAVSERNGSRVRLSYVIAKIAATNQSQRLPRRLSPPRKDKKTASLPHVRQLLRRKRRHCFEPAAE